MSDVVINRSAPGNALSTMLMAGDIEPGSEVGYQTAKAIYLYHPLGAKIAEAPIELAQSQRRKITIPESPEERVRKAFEDEWEAIGADRHILNAKKLSRIYGIASLAVVVKDEDTSAPLDFDKLAGADIGINCFDPLNTAGSLVLNQDPNAIDFQKARQITVNGKTYHRSRTVVVLNESPIYIGYTSSAFGYVGRSAYQRALFPLKSFVNTMVCNDLLALKAGVLVAKIKQPGSIIDKPMQMLNALKRNVVKEAKTGNVISISPDEAIESLNLQNVDGALTVARTNILKDCATAAKMPAKLLENETMVAGFGEGTEDAKNIAHWVDGIRREMHPLYAFFDKIVQRRAWNKEFYSAIQNEFSDEYGAVDYTTALMRWTNSFAAEWPSLLEESDSDKAVGEAKKLDAAVKAVAVMLPELDPDNKATVLEWLADTFSELKMLFPIPLVLNPDSLRDAREEDDTDDMDSMDHTAHAVDTANVERLRK